MSALFTSKQPTEEFYICFDFTDVLGVATIASVTSVIALDEASLADVTATVTDSTKQSNTTVKVYTWVRAGTADHRYVITCIILASDGSIYELDGILPVAELPAAGGDTGLAYHLLRQKFAELSGRYDLVTATWEDNGADFFINAGQQFLDRVSTAGKGIGKNVQVISAGTILVKTYDLRLVQEVWVGESVNGLVELTRYTLGQMRSYYGKQLSSVDRGTPAYYAIANLRPYPDTQSAGGWSGYYDIDDLVLGDSHYLYNGVVIMPPPDTTYYISIIGKYYSPKLTAVLSGSVWNETKSFWTERHPDVLLNAALYKLEVFYRNTEGAKDWRGALTEDLVGLDMDLAEESLKESQEMGG